MQFTKLKNIIFILLNKKYDIVAIVFIIIFIIEHY